MSKNLLKKVTLTVLSTVCVASLAVAVENLTVANADDSTVVTKAVGVVTGVDTKLRFTCEDTTAYAIGFGSYTTETIGNAYTGSIKLNGVELNVLSETYTNIKNYQIGGSGATNNIFISFKDASDNDLSKDVISTWTTSEYKKPTIVIAKDTIIQGNGKSVQITEDATFHFNKGYWQYGKFVLTPNVVGLTGKFGADMDCNLRFCATNLPNNFGSGNVATFNNDSITVEYTGTITLNGKDIKEYVKKGADDTTSNVDYISMGYCADMGWLPENFNIKFMSLTDLTEEDGKNVNVKSFERDESVYKYPTIFIAKDTVITNNATDTAIKFDKDYYIYYLSGKNSAAPYWVFSLDQTVPEVTINMNVAEGTTVSEVNGKISVTDDKATNVSKEIEWAQNVEDTTELAAGQYNITVTSKDETGNTSVVKIVLTVEEVKTEEPPVDSSSDVPVKEEKKSGCNSTADVMGVMLVSMMTVAGVALLKKKEN